ncbi:class I SAM-dependent methyltransferase [Candidatus Pelagibacter sp. RS39]|uniref:class I SAM-dependent methyltransferase n=1 Tax=Candidatus Pelagibacter sp. RS39 TaxID=1977864 RepID=UPI000A156241|nr:class I SAM-dependent methyltransferase [Candidatus Pelagibacter sp. RS39]ARJ47517.1 hypothetical protein B5L73_01620 [Candidatus Pelagibacter sp. RS39]
MTITNNNKCPNHICDGKIKIKYFSKNLDYKKINFSCTTDSYEKPSIYECLKCKIIFSEFIFQVDKNQIEKNYQDVVDDKYISQIKFKKYYFEKFTNKISRLINKDMNVLEIGSYYGVLGSVLKDKVKNYSGLELSTHGSNYSKEKFNLNIYNESIENHLKKKIKYDLIIMADVIEHFNDPFKVLSQINQLLNKNGKLILTTFNIDSLYAKITGRYYHWIIPFHNVFFSNQTLEIFGKNNNLKLVKILNDPRYVSFGYLIEKLILIFPKLSFMFKFLSKIKLLQNINIKVDLKDLKIYYFEKM